MAVGGAVSAKIAFMRATLTIGGGISRETFKYLLLPSLMDCPQTPLKSLKSDLRALEFSAQSKIIIENMFREQAIHRSAGACTRKYFTPAVVAKTTLTVSLNNQSILFLLKWGFWGGSYTRFFSRLCVITFPKNGTEEV